MIMFERTTYGGIGGLWGDDHPRADIKVELSEISEVGKAISALENNYQAMLADLRALLPDNQQADALEAFRNAERIK